MNELPEYIDKLVSRKLWAGVILPMLLLMNGYINSEEFTLVASVAIGGMALVDFGLAITGNRMDSWRKRQDRNDVETLGKK